MEEYFDVLDENGNPTGKKKLRKEVHRDGDWHRTVHIWIINGKKEILLQRRCKDKDSFPNMLDVSCGGHLSAGDSSLVGAIREIKEELNLDISKNDLEFLTTLKHTINYKEDFLNNQFEDIYILKKDIKLEDMSYQEEEISEIIYFSYKDFINMINNKDRELIIREEEFEILKDYLNNLK